MALSKEQCIQLRELLAEGVSQRAAADILGACSTTVHNRVRALNIPTQPRTHPTLVQQARDYLREHGPSSGRQIGLALGPNVRKALGRASGVYIKRYEDTRHGLTAVYALGNKPNAVRLPRKPKPAPAPVLRTSAVLQSVWSTPL